MKAPAESLSDFDWNFDNVPKEELEICYLWEYARESAFFRSVRERSRQSVGMKLPYPERLEFVERDFRQIWNTLDRKAILFQEGIYGFGGDEHFPDFVSRFPVAWQALSKTERSVLIKTNEWSAKAFLGLPGFRRSDSGSALALSKLFKPKSLKEVFSEGIPAQEYFHSGHKLRSVCPNYMYPSGHEILIVEINWGEFTNEQLVKEFARWLKENDPPGITRPDGRGQKMRDRRADLTKLAVMRLLARFRPLEIIDPRRDAFPAVWSTKQFSGPKWRDVTKWHDARREAGKLFRSMFPFLPADEKPVSWQRPPPGK